MNKTTHTTFIAILSLSLTIPACASRDWLEKGTELLNDIQEEQSANKVSPEEISLNDMAGAFKQALHLGSETVTNKLGKTDGFNADPAIHIPLPQKFKKVRKVLRKIGMQDSVDDLEVKLNRAAEAATPKAKALFWRSIKDMTFKDVKRIYEGPEDSATQYFQGKMTSSLKAQMQPVVDESLSKVGAIKAYDKVVNKYQSIPLVADLNVLPDVRAELTNHVVDGAVTGIFHYLAQEEAEIRKNPVRQTTDLLKRVFGK